MGVCFNRYFAWSRQEFRDAGVDLISVLPKRAILLGTATGAKLEGDAWICGRTTDAAVDMLGELRWSSGDPEGDHLVCVVSERVSADYLAMLQLIDLISAWIGLGSRSLTPRTFPSQIGRLAVWAYGVLTSSVAAN